MYRKKAGFQQQQVAKMLGLKTTGLISRWENSVSYPDLINVFKLSLIYKADINNLYRDLRELTKQELTYPI